MVIKQQTVDIFSLPTVGVTKLRQSYNTMKVNVQFITQGTIHMLPLLTKELGFSSFISTWNLKTSSKEFIGESVAAILRNLIKIYI